MKNTLEEFAQDLLGLREDPANDAGFGFEDGFDLANELLETGFHARGVYVGVREFLPTVKGGVSGEWRL